MNRARVRELFAEAIDLPADERSAWLATQCGDDAALRAEVEQLLRADAKAHDFMESPPASVADAAAAFAHDASPATFGVYRVVRSLGQGGMGEVWLAERNDGEFEQRVAIKRLTYPTPGLLQRFRLERQILARLEHPNIARLIDGGLDANGIPYLAMEYVEGVPITAYARDRGLGVAARLRLFVRVCEAVQYAHQNLVVHRDLKPSNIFVIADGTPKLLDFGIAKVLTTDDSGEATQTIARLMTPDYAAPEQFTGDAITTATDVYALGIVLYELLAGTRPYRSAKTGDAAVIAALRGDAPAPSAAVDRTSADGAARRRALRGDLDRIALKAIAKEPARRYASAEALAADVRRHLEGRPVTARGDGAWYRLGKFVRRNRYALAAAIFVVAIGVAATVVSLEQAARANAQAARAEAARRFLIGVFEQASPDENRGRPMTAHELLEKGEQRLAGADLAAPATRADLTGLIGGLYWDLGDYARAEPLLKEALALTDANDIPGEVKARVLVTAASVESERSQNDDARQHAEKALAHAERAGAIAAPERSDALRIHVRILTEQGDLDRAETEVRRLLADDEIAYGKDSIAVAKDWALLAHALDELSRYPESVAAFEKALALDRNLLGARSAQAGQDLNDLGFALSHKGDYVAAERVLGEALDIKREIYGAAHRETLVARANLIMAGEKQGRYEEGLQARLALLVDQRQILGDTHKDELARAENMIGLDGIMLGRPDEAERALRASVALWREAGSEIDSAGPLGNLAFALRMQGRYADAEAALRETIAIEAKHYPPSSEWLNQDRGFLGDLLRLEHRYDEALAELRAAIAAVKSSVSEADPVLAKLQAQLAEAELDAGAPAQAAETAASALAAARATLPAGNIGIGQPLYALARAKLALERPDEAEPLLREALAVRSPPLRAEDLRVLEVKSALVVTLSLRDRDEEADALRREIEPQLRASPTPYARDLLERLPNT
ncbi:MAG TPA: tetratricopeptide repeat protein [Rhodanobacteraceae bacterium]|nr:tetratricopeptide repeat protein [Rhodanobacteraceae bacterium]